MKARITVYEDGRDAGKPYAVTHYVRGRGSVTFRRPTPAAARALRRELRGGGGRAARGL